MAVAIRLFWRKTINFPVPVPYFVTGSFSDPIKGAGAGTTYDDVLLFLPFGQLISPGRRDGRSRQTLRSLLCLLIPYSATQTPTTARLLNHSLPRYVHSSLRCTYIPDVEIQKQATHCPKTPPPPIWSQELPWHKMRRKIWRPTSESN